MADKYTNQEEARRKAAKGSVQARDIKPTGISKGETRSHHSSPGGESTACGKCGPQIEELEKTLNDLKIQLEHLEEKKDEVERKRNEENLDHWKEREISLKEKDKRLRKTKEEHASVLKDKETQFNSLKTEMWEQQDKYDSTLKEREENIIRLQNYMRRKNKERASVLKENEDKFHSLETDKRSHQEECELKLKEKEDDITTLVAKLSKTKQEHASVLKDKETEFNSLKTKMSEQQDGYDAILKKKEDYIKRHQDYISKQKKEHESILKGKEDEIDSLKTKMREEQDKCDSTFKEREEKTQKLQADMRRHFEGCKLKLKDIENEFTTLEAKLRSDTSDYVSVLQRHAEYQAPLDSEIKEQQDKYDSTLKGREENIERLQDDMSLHEALKRNDELTEWNRKRRTSVPLSSEYRQEKIAKEEALTRDKIVADIRDTIDFKTIHLIATSLANCCKKLEKMEKDITRKEQKEHSKKLPKKKHSHEFYLAEFDRHCSELDKLVKLKTTENDDEGGFKRSMRGSFDDTVKQGPPRHGGTGKERRSDAEMNLREALKRNDELTEWNRKLKEELDDKQRTSVPLSEYRQERIAKEEALTRLSSIASNRLLDNNPNIADLSDENRPTKIGEKFSELYDNQWTDAFDVLNEKEQKKETECIEILLQTLTATFQHCEEKATEDLRQIQELIGTKSSDVMVPVKTARKKSAEAYVDELKPPGPIWQGTQYKELDVFSRKCLELCWLMVVQDPPLCLHSPQRGDNSLDTKLYREYTERGPYIKFVVWPPMLLHRNGPIVSKGVAQGCSEPDVIDTPC